MAYALVHVEALGVTITVDPLVASIELHEDGANAHEVTIHRKGERAPGAAVIVKGVTRVEYERQGFE